MSAPRNKRQFAGAAADPAQRQITRFFSPSTGGGAVQHLPPPRDPPSRPDLPIAVQNDLMQVGMRIRKSVPEGYKTGDDSYGAFKLFSDNARPGHHAAARRQRQQRQYVSAESQRELLPFSGIHKIGGLSCQPTVAIMHDGDAGAGGVPGLDDVPGLSSSQESYLEDDDEEEEEDGHGPPSVNNNRKRFFEENDRPDVPVDHHLKVRQDWLDGEISPRTMAPLDWRDNRRMAVPRRRGMMAQGKASVVGGGAPGHEGQENMMMDDFKDADFLDENLLDVMQMDA